MLSPLPIKVKLAKTPESAPKYFLEKSLSGGGKIKLGDPRATRAVVALMDMNAVLGGAASHYGGPAAFAELMSAVHGLMFHEALAAKVDWHSLFNFVNDAGHCENGIYALRANYGFSGLSFKDLRQFRSIESKLTGHGESHLYPEGVLLSNGPLGSGFPQSQGLAMADAMAGNSRVTVTAISDGASMEGEAKEAFAAIPGFAAKGMMAPYVLIISDNNTKLTGRIDKESFSMRPTFESLKTLGWDLIELKDGHDLQACLSTIEDAFVRARKNPKVPVAIHAHTIKGVGTKKTAESASGGHGFPLKSGTEVLTFITEIYGGDQVPQEFQDWAAELVVLEQKLKEKKSVSQLSEKIQVGISQAMIKAAKKGLPVVSITSDLPGSTGVAEFRKEFPQCSIDVGVAEANMISTAAGFSKAGFVPVVDTFAQFGVTKGALPLTMASLSQAPMICVFSHTGFQDAADGASHQALTYLSMIAGIPSVKAYALTCSEEAEALMTEALNEFANEQIRGRSPTSYIFFLGRENFPRSFNSATYQLNQAQVLFDNTQGGLKSGKKVALVMPGSMLGEGLAAAKILESEGCGVILINPVCLNYHDLATISSAIEKAGGNLVVAEDHQVIGGYGALLTHALANAGVRFKLKSLGVHAEFGQSAYNAIELYKKHGLDSNAIVHAARDLF